MFLNWNLLNYFAEIMITIVSVCLDYYNRSVTKFDAGIGWFNWI